MAAVLVHIDLDGPEDARVPNASSLAALAAGRALASAWGATLYAGVIVDASEATGLATTLGRALGHAGADRVVIAPTVHPVGPLWALLGAAWQGVLDQLRPRVVLFGAAAPAAAELAPRTGARLGARLLTYARVVVGDQLELRDREGAFVRASESGAAVALVATRAAVDATGPGSEHIEVTELAPTADPDRTIDLVATELATPEQTRGIVVALGVDATGDRATRTAAKLLAAQLGATIVDAAQLDDTTAFAPDLYIAVGRVVGDLAGCASLVRLGVDPADRRKGDDGTLAGSAETAITDLVRTLEER